MRTLRLILLSTAVLPRFGGPFESVAGLARGLALDPATDVTVLACTSRGRGWEEHRRHWGEARLSIHEGGCLGRLTSTRRYLQERLRRGSVDVVHASGLWDETAILVRTLLSNSGVPVVWSVRGMLEPWALGHHAARKRLAWIALQRAALNATTVIHATADPEASSCRQAGLRQPITVIPNGIDVQPLQMATLHGEASRPRRCGYLGRLHPKKGLPNLIEAWSRCDTIGWELVIAGPDSDGHAAVLTALVHRHALTNVYVTAPCYAAERQRFLNDCDLFICPSYSENFGNAIAEAMERAKPVITTTGTPWSVLERAQMGWWVNPTPDALAHALTHALGSPPDVLRAMGARCRVHVENSYSWPQVVRQMRMVYDWLCGGDCPDSVTFSPQCGERAEGRE